MQSAGHALSRADKDVRVVCDDDISLESYDCHKWRYSKRKANFAWDDGVLRRRKSVVDHPNNIVM